jgi:hypothetical protein
MSGIYQNPGPSKIFLLPVPKTLAIMQGAGTRFVGTTAIFTKSDGYSCSSRQVATVPEIVWGFQTRKKSTCRWPKIFVREATVKAQAAATASSSRDERPATHRRCEPAVHRNNIPDKRQAATVALALPKRSDATRADLGSKRGRARGSRGRVLAAARPGTAAIAAGIARRTMVRW